MFMAIELLRLHIQQHAYHKVLQIAKALHQPFFKPCFHIKQRASLNVLCKIHTSTLNVKEQRLSF